MKRDPGTFPEKCMYFYWITTPTTLNSTLPSKVWIFQSSGSYFARTRQSLHISNWTDAWSGINQVSSCDLNTKVRYFISTKEDYRRVHKFQLRLANWEQPEQFPRNTEATWVWLQKPLSPDLCIHRRSIYLSPRPS